MKQSVYLAIPNYNMSAQLEKLLPTVIDRGYEHIFVFDDASSDKSEQVAARFEKQGVSFVKAEQNRGAATTRDRILDYHKEGLVHFLDADVMLAGAGNAADEVAEAFDRHPDAAAIGFHVLNPDGTQYAWNFGPRRSIMDGPTWASLAAYKRLRSGMLRRILCQTFEDRWDNFWTYAHPEDAEREQKVGAVVECNMAVRLDTFSKVGGFDGALRFHEIHSLVCKLDSLGHSVWYAPILTVYKSFDADVRDHRTRDMRISQLILDFKRMTKQYNIKI